MASITVLCPNAHRFTQSVAPNTLLFQVMEKAALSNGYDPNLHGLKFQGRWVDLSLAYRHSELPNNVTLELAKLSEQEATKKVTLGLQFVDTHREFMDFSPNTTLSNVLKNFSGRVGEDLLAVLPHNADEYAVPTVSYLSNKWYSAIFSFVTLKSMGISTKTVVRYARETVSHEQLAQIESLATREIADQHKLQELYLRKKAENEEREHIAKLQEQQSKKGAIHSTPKAVTDSLPDRKPRRQTERTDVTGVMPKVLNIGEPMAEFAGFKFPYQPITTVQQVFSPTAGCSSHSESNSNQKLHNPLLFDPFTESAKRRNAASKQSNDAEEDDDAFYEVGIEDMRKMVISLQKEGKPRALLTKKFVEEKDRELMQQAYRHTTIRFRLLGRYVLQAQFVSVEPVSALFHFVCEHIMPNVRFELSQIPSGKLHPDDQQTLLAAGLAPKCALVLRITDPENGTLGRILNVKTVRQCSGEEANASSVQWLSVNTVFRPYLSTLPDNGNGSAATPAATSGLPQRADQATDQTTNRPRPPPRRPSSGGQSLPKWMKRK